MSLKLLETLGRNHQKRVFGLYECSECHRKIILASDTASRKDDCGCVPKLRKNGKDLVGMRFGKLTVIEFAGTAKSGTMWKCLCDCGKEHIVSRSNLFNGNVRSCGCDRNRNFENLVGRKFGQLTVVEPAPSKNGKRCWKCLCDCGNMTVVTTGALKSGNTTSCGCVHRKMVSQIWKKRKNVQKSA